MNVLILSPYPKFLIPTLEAAGDSFVIRTEKEDVWPQNTDFIVSFGYRHIIKEPQLIEFEDRLINIHTSYLPWNRGAHPNFWSWFDRTPKGVSIHFVDEGIDTGDVIAQAEVMKWEKQETLKSSYEYLLSMAGKIFAIEWHNIRRGRWIKITNPANGGTYHTSKEIEPWMNKLPLEWDTPVGDVEILGDARHKIN